MKSSVEKLNDTRVKITVEVPFEELNREFDAAYKAIAQQVTIPGFRKGKAPRKLIDARFGRGVVIEQVVNDMLPSRYGQAVSENELHVFGQPAIEVTKVNDGELVEFTAEVDVRPEISLPNFEEIEVTVPALSVDEEAVEAELTHLRARFGSLKDVDRAAQKGDFVTLDLSATVDGEEIEDAKTTDMSHEVGNGELIDGMDDAIEGLKAGESSEFTTQLAAGEHKGEDATVTVTVKTVKERELPEADDDFAQMASEFDTIAELRESLAKKVEDEAKAKQAADIRDEVLKAALERSPFPLPEGVVEDQVNAQREQLLAQFGGDEAVVNTMLEAQGTTPEEFAERSRTQSEEAVRNQLFLDTLADDLQPEVSQQELSEHIMFTAQRYGMDPRQFLSQLQNSGQVAALYSDVRRAKALAAAICKVTVKDTEGNTVDATQYFGEEEDESSQEQSAE